MSFSPRALLFLFLTTAAASAQCPVDTVIIKGRIENPVRAAKVRAQLLYANDQPTAYSPHSEVLLKAPQ